MYREPIQRITMRFPKALLDEVELFAKDNMYRFTDRSKCIHHLVKVGLEAERERKAKKGKRGQKTARDYYQEALEIHCASLEDVHKTE